MPRAPTPFLRPKAARAACPLPPGARLPRPRVWRPVVQTLIILLAVAVVGFAVKLVADAF